MFGGIAGLVKNTELIGLDIGTHTIKLVEIDHQKSVKVLNTFASIPHTTNLDGYWDATTLRQLATTIDTVMQHSKFVGIKTVMSIRSKDVFVTSMDFEKDLSDSAIQHEINQQAPFFLPLPPEEMRLSFDLLKQPTISGKRRVVINATPDYIIENHRNLLEHLNLDGEAIENATLAQVRALPAEESDYILVDLGANHTVFSTILGNSLRSSTFLSNGTHSITQHVSELLGTTAVTSENLLHDFNLVNLSHLPKPILDYCETILHELDTYALETQQLGLTTKKVLLTGGGCNTPGVLEILTQSTHQIRISNPLFNVTIRPEILPYLAPKQHQYATAIGLALKLLE